MCRTVLRVCGRPLWSASAEFGYKLKYEITKYTRDAYFRNIYGSATYALSIYITHI